MSHLLVYLGDLRQVMGPAHASVASVLAAIVCGTIIGLEREAKHKPAGLRTVSLICLGSTIFTLVSILIAADAPADRGRIAAQVATGVGFLGAGAIIREHGAILGLTTAATIWVVAAIGVLIGAGYAAGGLAITIIVVTMLIGERFLDRLVHGPCRYAHCRITYRPENGKTRLHILHLLDESQIPPTAWTFSQQNDHEIVEVAYCHAHRNHRDVLHKLANLSGLVRIDADNVGH